MAFETVFARVLRRLPNDDAIALASQKDKVIRLLHKELLVEGILAVKLKEGESSVQRRGVVASPQKDFSVSVGTEALTGSAFSETHRYAFTYVVAKRCMFLHGCSSFSRVANHSDGCTVHLIISPPV